MGLMNQASLLLTNKSLAWAYDDHNGTVLITYKDDIRKITLNMSNSAVMTTEFGL